LQATATEAEDVAALKRQLEQAAAEKAELVAKVARREKELDASETKAIASHAELRALQVSEGVEVLSSPSFDRRIFSRTVRGTGGGSSW
jgi:hypothetical protein